MKTCWISTIFLLLFLILTSCGDDALKNDMPDIEFTSEMPEVPVSMDIDIDADGIVDYKFRYGLADVESLTSDLAIWGEIKPYGDNQLLDKLQERELFLRDLDEIQEDVTEPLRWRNAVWAKTFAMVYNDIEKGWPNRWEVNGDKEHNSYFVGMKIIENNNIKLGWVEFEIDLSNGKVKVLNKSIL